ncbi:hypothetical protein [Microbaculum sp. FT89]|uniref:hypothetical protein n=1 Tax=Microbaculum sp. FT89 TaxID=3447298 RepID=UPI003F52F7E7
MRSVVFIVAAGAVLSATGCAKRADQISASYVSPIAYQNYTCEQIAQESLRISARAQQVAGTQDKKASRDAVAMGVGIVIFWPALFAINGDDQQTAELARLRGEMEALEQASIQKNCNITFESEPADRTS